MNYDWDLVERLLLNTQQSVDEPFKARECGEEVAQQRLARGEGGEVDVDHTKRVAGDLEGVLYEGGFITDRPREHGGTGNNFELTARGSRLLTLIGASFPEHQAFRQLLDEQGEGALTAPVFDDVAERAARDRVDDKPER